MEDYTAEMIRDMAFSFCPQCGTAIVPNHKGRPRKFCSPECRSRWNNTHPKPENWKTVRSKICPVCGREFSYRHQYGLERKYCSRACANRGEREHGGRYILDEYEWSRNHCKAVTVTIRRWKRDLKKKARAHNRRVMHQAM